MVLTLLYNVVIMPILLAVDLKSLLLRGLAYYRLRL